MTDQSITTGLVTVCDILGYRAFMRNADPADYKTRDVLLILNACPGIARSETHRLLPDLQGFPQAIESILPVVFSDTIVATLAFNDSDDYHARIVKWISFCTYIQAVEWVMINAFLPIRGCIAQGAYHADHNSYAGRCIIDAFDISADMHLSAVCITDEAYGQLARHVSEKVNLPVEQWMKDMFCPYPVPCHSKPFNKSWLLRPSQTFGITKETDPATARRSLIKVFTAHNKGLNVSASEKIDNTLHWYRSIEAI